MALVDTLTGDPANAFSQLLANTERLREAFIGTTAPTDVTATEGQLWVDNSADPHVLKIFIDTTGSGTPSWQAVSGLIGANVDYLLYQLVNARVENSGSDMTPAANNVGRILHHTTRETIEVILNSGQLGFIDMMRSDRYLPMLAGQESWTLDATSPPTPIDVAHGVGGNFRGLLFDATNERMSKWFRVPAGWVSNADIVLRVKVLLNASETSGDDIKVEANWIKQTPNDNTEVASKNATNVQVAHDIGSVIAQYTMHSIDITLDHDVAANPVATGDMINIEFGLYAIDEVAGVIFVDAELLFAPSDTSLES